MLVAVPAQDLLRDAIAQIIPLATIEKLVAKLGVQQRRRLLNPNALVVNLILVGGTAEAGRLAAVLRDYSAQGNPKVARSAAYRWFDQALLELVRELVAEALAYVHSMPHSLPGILAGRRDWRVFDSTTVKLPPQLKGSWRGTGDYAALKVHKEYSLGLENVVAYHIGPAREHDALHLVVDERRRGTGLLVDLGYASHGLLRSCEEHDVAYVIRAKGGWRIFVDELADPSTWTLPEGCPAGALTAEQVLVIPSTGDVDLDVTVGPDEDPIPTRLVAFTANNERVTLLTNLPRDTHPLDAVGMLYRLRWSIEIDNKLVKTGCQLDEITAETPVPAEILVHASMLASILANALCHAAHVEDGGVDARAPKMSRPPLHAMLVWKYMVTASSGLAAKLTGDAPMDWNQWRGIVLHLGADHNWRTRPSPLDEVKGRVPSRRPWRPGKRMQSAQTNAGNRKPVAK